MLDISSQLTNNAYKAKAMYCTIANLSRNYYLFRKMNFVLVIWALVVTHKLPLKKSNYVAMV